MELLVLLLLLLPLPAWITLGNDPAPGIMQTKAESRNLDCRRISAPLAHQRHPGVVAEPSPRGSYIDSGAVICRGRVMQYGERGARDEVILSNLSASAEVLAQAASALEFVLPTDTWLVDSFYPEPTVAAKISFATKVSLVARGHRVSDRVPVLAAGDVLVLHRMPAMEAYPAACARYCAEGGLGDNEVLLAVALIDARETILHAGLCARGAWKWVR